LLPLELVHLSSSIFVAARRFACQRVYLLLTPDRIRLRYSGVPVVPDLELRVLHFLNP
jgi:hypothetical protein